MYKLIHSGELVNGFGVKMDETHQVNQAAHTESIARQLRQSTLFLSPSQPGKHFDF